MKRYLLDIIYIILSRFFALQVQWQSEQEKQESKSIYATEDDAVVRSKTPAIEYPGNTIASA